MPPTQTAPTRLVASDAGTDVRDAKRVHALPVGASSSALSTGVDHISPGRATHAVRPADAGSMLRACRQSRGLTVEQVAAGFAIEAGWNEVAALNYLIAVETYAVQRSGGLVVAILDAIHALEHVSSQERDAILAAAGVLAPDLVARLLERVGSWDAVRALLDGGA